MRCSAIIVSLLVALLTGCWETRKGPEVVDLAGPNSEIEQTIVRLSRIEETMSAELDALRAAKAAFFDEPRSAWARPFPLDAFRHTAMSCLNAPMESPEPEPELALVAERLQISCPVPAARALEQRFGEVPAHRAFGIEKLREIDAVREARHRIQQRLRQLPEIARRTRNYLAVRRAEARQIETDIERRRTEYARADYAAALDHVQAHRRRLDDLDAAIREVEQGIPRWSREVGAAVDQLYKDLSRLGSA